MPHIVNGIEELKGEVGKTLGYSGWLEVTQEQVNLFADATGDHQWIHVDPERAKAGPFGGPIVHGYLTLSLVASMLTEVVRVRGIKMGVNYGLNKLRFPSPVPVGSKIRLAATLALVKEVPGGVEAAFTVIMERDDSDKPALAGEVIFRYQT